MGWGDCLFPKRNKFRQKANNVAQIRRKRYNFQEMEKTKKYFKKTRDRWRTFVPFPNAGETMIKRTERSRELRKQPSFAATLEIQRERKKESLANSPHFIERTAAGNLLPPPPTLHTHTDQLQLPAKQHPIDLSPAHPSFPMPAKCDVF